MFDQKYLREHQYHTAANLQARINLHRRFGRDDTPWTQWLQEQLPLPSNPRLLDIGCGPGTLWRETLTRLPAGLFTLADLSLGMVQNSATALGSDTRFTFLQADAQHLPFESEHFDGALANHMLYHVPDIPLALDELRRVIHPGGWLCAASNGRNHMHELNELIARYLPGFVNVDHSFNRFGLEMGAELLATFFSDVRMLVHDSDLWVTETAPLVEYIRSMWRTESSDTTWLENLAAEVDETIRQHGGFHISRAGGVLLARRA